MLEGATFNLAILLMFDALISISGYVAHLFVALISISGYVAHLFATLISMSGYVAHLFVTLIYMLNWFMNYLSNRYQFVSMNNTSSSFLRIWEINYD